MNNTTFRRGGLFDPITFDSGRALAQGTGEFFGGFGNPIMKASNPADWEALADKKLSMGDMAGAEQAQDRAKQLRAAYDQQEQVRQMQRAALNKMHGENDVLLAETLGQEKQAEIAKAQRQKAVEALSTRFGKENAELLISLPPDKRGDIIKEMMKGKDVQFKDLVNPQTGHTETWVIDEDGNKVKMVGLKSIKEDAADSESSRKSAMDTLEAARAVLADTDGMDAYSGYSGSMPTVKPKTKSFMGKMDQLLGLLTLENTDLLTGILSDTDIALLRAAGTRIKEGGEEKQNIAEVQRIIHKLEDGLGLPRTDFSEKRESGTRSGRFIVTEID